MPSIKHLVLGSLLAAQLVVGHAFAQGVPDSVRDAINARLKVHLDGEPQAEIKMTPMAGIYKIDLGGGQFLYTNGDGSYMIAGELYDFSGDKLVNLAEQDRRGERQSRLKALDVKKAIVFAPKGETKAVLNVFTDVDCGYCQLFHQQVPELNAAGVEIRYLAFPRGGITSPTYPKMVTAWCSANPKETLTALKNREKVDIKTCEENPVLEEFEMGNAFGVRGTPSLVMMDGTLIPGYKPAEELLVDLGIEQQAN